MSPMLGWPAYGTDPLPQLLADHPSFVGSEELIVPSHLAALAVWRTVETHPCSVSIILRRVGQEEEMEWRDALAILRQLVLDCRKDVRLLALNVAAAASLAAEIGLAVHALPPLPAIFGGGRMLTLSRAGGELQVIRETAKPLPARNYNLARLRRMAKIEAEAGDPDLADIAAFANGETAAGTAERRRAPVVIIVVPNGVGLGHVTRMLAVAGNLKMQTGARVVFWSFSRGAGIISRFGFETVLRQTAHHIGADVADWTRWETEEFAAAVGHLKPDLVVQDSSALQPFVIDALARAGSGGARLALVRRGTWQQNMLPLDALDSEDLADIVIEPGDLASEADRGITRGRSIDSKSFADMAVSAPVILTRPDDLLDRRRARKALGLGRSRICLVSLGGDAFGDAGLLRRQIVGAAKRAGVRLVWALSPLAAPDPDLEFDPGIATRSIFPLAPFLKAFDGVISTAGYNSFHELMQLCDRPVLLVPKRHSTLDDQPARASHAAARGWAARLDGDTRDDSVLSSFMADIRASKTVSGRPEWRDGAAEVASLLAALIGAGAETK